MALPPIISNSPLMKLFKTGPGAKAEAPQSAKNSNMPQDVVELSAAARKRLDGVKTALNAEQARDAAAAVKDELGRSNVSLGLDNSKIS